MSFNKLLIYLFILSMVLLPTAVLAQDSPKVDVVETAQAGSTNKQNEPNTDTLKQDVVEHPTYIIYVHADCPHCKQVEAYVAANNLQDYVIYKQLKNNDANMAELEALWKELGIDQTGWPFLVEQGDKSNYVGGDTPIINLLATEFGLETTVDNSQETTIKSTSNSDKIFFTIGGLFVFGFIGYAIYSFIKEY